VTEQISPVAYRIGLPSEMKVHNVFHADLLSPYRSTSAYGPVDVRPPPEVIEGEEEYEVESIIKAQQRGPKRVLSYLVKWKGYPDSENSWVKQVTYTPRNYSKNSTTPRGWTHQCINTNASDPNTTSPPRPPAVFYTTTAS
jgi:hypothetical protein